MVKAVAGEPSVDTAPHVLWLIKGLGPGGAEHLLVAAAAARDRTAFSYEVAYLLPWKDALVPRLDALGVPSQCYDARKPGDLRWLLRLRRRLVSSPVAIVHVHSPYVAAFTRLVVRTVPARLRPKVVSTEHNAWSTFRGPTRTMNALTARLDDAIIAVSEETRASMSPRVRARAETLVHGIPIDDVRANLADREAVRAELGVDDTTVLVGTVANYHPKKDWPTLLRTARIVADRGLPVRFCAVGQGPLEQEVVALHEQLALGDVVTLTGFRPDAVRLMAGCDVFLMTSKWEGLPVALMEALALGLPVVATAVGGVAETLADGVEGRLVAPERPDLLADAIGELVGDPAARRRYAAAAASRAGEFDVKRSVRRIEAVYRETLAR